jgi:hypothetical protein
LLNGRHLAGRKRPAQPKGHILIEDNPHDRFWPLETKRRNSSAS